MALGTRIWRGSSHLPTMCCVGSLVIACEMCLPNVLFTAFACRLIRVELNRCAVVVAEDGFLHGAVLLRGCRRR